MITTTFLLLSSVVFADTFTITSPPPSTWYPYPPQGSLFDKPLPVDKMNHLWVPANYGITTGGTGDQFAQWALTADGNQSASDPNYLGFTLVDSAASNGPGANDQGKPTYYATASDPWYYFDGSKFADTPGLQIRLHAPNGAQFSGGKGDCGIEIFDQAQNILLSIYSSGVGSGGKLPACTATTAATACTVIPGTPGSDGGTLQLGAGAAQRTAVDADFPHPGVTEGPYTINGVSETLGYSGDNMAAGAAGSGAGRTRFTEMMNGIFHAMGAGIYCGYPNKSVYPVRGKSVSGSGMRDCTTSLVANPNHWVPDGALFFVDYTDAQIAAMNLPAAQKIILTALAHYGTYINVTGGSLNVSFQVISDDEMESEQAWFNAFGTHHPIFSWLNGQNLPGGCFNSTSPSSYWRCNWGPLSRIPLVNGTGILNHVHILDPCAVSGMVGSKGASPPTACTGEIIVGITGNGSVTSNPAGLNCDHAGWCSIGYALNTSITLTAAPASGQSFAGWSGACTGTGTCTLTTASTAKNAVANFTSITNVPPAKPQGVKFN